jgi:hypothetical protein
MWNIHHAPPNIPIACPAQSVTANHWEEAILCPIFSAGPQVEFNELIFPRMHRAILDWTNQVAKDPDFINPEFVLQDFPVEEGSETDADEDNAGVVERQTDVDVEDNFDSGDELV